MKSQIILTLSSVILFITVSTSLVKAQGYASDAFRLSQASIGGTTRTISIGGANAALGGDIGTLNANPAGLGFYRRSDFSLTTQYNSNSLETNYFGNRTLSPNQNDFNLENVGIVFAQSSPQADYGRATHNSIVSYAFGAGYTRYSDLNTNTTFSGTNFGSNFTSNLAELATNNGLEPQISNSGNGTFASDISDNAYNGYLINPVSSNSNSFTGIPSGSLGAIQSATLLEQGFKDQGNFSFGLNFGNVVYLGTGLNFESYNYTRNTDFIESGLSDTYNKVDGLEYQKNTYQSGSGINGKLGIIFNLLNVIHVGGYVQTPTNYDVLENVDFTLYGTKSGNYITPVSNGKDTATYGLPSGAYQPTSIASNEFHVKTPYKYDLGASLMLGEFGFLSGDVEYINYKETSFDSGNSSDAFINSEIQAKYKDVFNYKAGAELKFGPIVLRGGYAYYPSYLTDVSQNSDRQILSGGLGIHVHRFYIDFGGLKDYSRSYRQVYSFADGSGPIVKSYNIRTSGTITIGTRF